MPHRRTLYPKDAHNWGQHLRPSRSPPHSIKRGLPRAPSSRPLFHPTTHHDLTRSTCPHRFFLFRLVMPLNIIRRFSIRRAIDSHAYLQQVNKETISSISSRSKLVSLFPSCAISLSSSLLTHSLQLILLFKLR
jgi:hypothetical protein